MRPPRVWPALILLAGVIPAVLLVSGAVLFAAFVVASVGGDLRATDSKSFELWLDSILPTPMGLFVVLLPIQVTLLILAVGPALLSRQGWRRRLALEAPRAGLVVHLAALLGTLGLSYVSEALVVALFDAPSDSLELVSRLLFEPEGAYGASILVIGGLAPGLCEELFFRGYVQARLVQRFDAWLGIAAPGVMFAALHFDPQHMLGVLLPGLWFGFVAWRTGSTWTSVLCHALNNIGVGLAVRVFGEDSADPYELTLSHLTLGAAGLLVAGVAMRTILRRTPDGDARASQPSSAALGEREAGP